MFENDYIYTMFTSTYGCKVEILVEFPSEEDKRKRRKDQPEETEEKKYDTNLAKFLIK